MHRTSQPSKARQDSLTKLERILDRHGCTGSGRDWVVHALDPVSLVRSAPAPTADGRASVRPIYRLEHTVSTPIESQSVDQLWDLCIIQTGGDNTICYWCAAPAGSNFNNLTGGETDVVVGSMYCNSWLEDQAAFILSDGAITSRPTMRPARDFAAFRRTAASVTAYYVGATIDNAGSVAATRYSAAASRRYLQTLDTSGNQLVDMAVEVPMSFQENDFIMQDDNPYIGRAADGIYMPQLIFPGPYRQASTCIGESVTLNDPDNLQKIGLCMTLGHPIAHSLRVYNPTTGGTVRWVAALATGDTDIDTSSTSVIVFRGLGASASILIKGILALDAVPMFDSIERPYVDPPAVYDPCAIEAYELLRAKLPSGFPAEYNFLGFLPTIIAALATSLFASAKAVAISAGTAAIGAATSAAISAGVNAAIKEKPKVARAMADAGQRVMEETKTVRENKAKPLARATSTVTTTKTLFGPKTATTKKQRRK